jgi:hypothetical protein
MPITRPIKGLQSLQSMQNAVKSGIPNKEDSDFIKMYIFEKERSRLQTEEIKLHQRLEIIHKRLNEINVFGTEKLGLNRTLSDSKTKKSKKDGENEWETMSIDY